MWKQFKKFEVKAVRQSLNVDNQLLSKLNSDERFQIH